jgi:hypothetical protein
MTSLGSFQDFWATKVLWEKLILGEDSQILLVKWMTCSILERKDKFLSPKLDILQKNIGQNKIVVAWQMGPYENRFLQAGNGAENTKEKSRQCLTFFFEMPPQTSRGKNKAPFKPALQ